MGMEFESINTSAFAVQDSHFHQVAGLIHEDHSITAEAIRVSTDAGTIEITATPTGEVEIIPYDSDE